MKSGIYKYLDNYFGDNFFVVVENSIEVSFSGVTNNPLIHNQFRIISSKGGQIFSVYKHLCEFFPDVPEAVVFVDVNISSLLSNFFSIDLDESFKYIREWFFQKHNLNDKEKRVEFLNSYLTDGKNNI